MLEDKKVDKAMGALARALISLVLVLVVFAGVLGAWAIGLLVDVEFSLGNVLRAAALWLWISVAIAAGVRVGRRSE